MKLNLQLVRIEPGIDEQGKDLKEFLNVHFVASVTPEQFAELKKLTNVWGIEVETKSRKK